MINKIAVIGLGYVGLPLAYEFSKKYITYGYDVSQTRIEQLKKFNDNNLEISTQELKSVIDEGGKPNLKGLNLSDSLVDLKECNVYIITVPTPIDKDKRPDLSPLKSASKSIGSILNKGDLVIYESTVFPGATEEICIPIIESVSKMKLNKDFFIGYSPERINPGDKINTLTKIKKVTSGSNIKTAKKVDELYNSILHNGTHLAPSIKVAEASKVIENAQRDLNISFVNELALIFERMNLDTNAVLEAAETKWNFLKFKPGLVGGHCISVDPYYLTHKAESLGYFPEVIYSGRKVNEFIPKFVAGKVVKLMISKGIKILHSNVLILGFTFKENCTDIRNSRVIDIKLELESFGCNVNVCDTWASQQEIENRFNFKIINNIKNIYTISYDAIILAVSHTDFEKVDFKKLSNNSKSVIYDIKNFIPINLCDGRL